MSADAIARLREAVDSDIDTVVNDEDVVVHRADLRAAVDRLEVLETAFAAARPSLEKEALDALEGLWSTDQSDHDPRHVDEETVVRHKAASKAAYAVLAKAGRR